MSAEGIWRESAGTAPPAHAHILRDLRRKSYCTDEVVAEEKEPMERLKSGFTLLELLVTIAIISLLTALLSPALQRARNASKRVSCLSNIRQLGLASQMYSDDDSRHRFSSKSNYEDQDLNCLFPYAKSTRVFVCPATQNIIGTNGGTNLYTRIEGVTDLINLSKTVKSGFGKSYQGLGFAGRGGPTLSTIQTPSGELTISGYVKSPETLSSTPRNFDTVGRIGIPVGPSESWIMIDNGLLGGIYYPDSLDNHKDAGSNVAFCDGHAEWVDKRQYIYRYELSQDEGRTRAEWPW